MPTWATELKKRYRLGSNSEPVCVLLKLFEVVGWKRIIGERKGEQRSEEGVEGLDFGSEGKFGS